MARFGIDKSSKAIEFVDGTRAGVTDHSVGLEAIDEYQTPLTSEFDRPSETTPQIHLDAKGYSPESEVFYFGNKTGFRLRLDSGTLKLEKWNTGTSSWDLKDSWS